MARIARIFTSGIGSINFMVIPVDLSSEAFKRRRKLESRRGFKLILDPSFRWDDNGWIVALFTFVFYATDGQRELGRFFCE